MAIYDISRPIVPGIPVWPGDTSYSEHRTWHLGPDSPVNVFKIELSTHTGSHADAPFHYDESGQKIGAIDVNRYVGPCVVLDVSGSRRLVEPEHLSDIAWPAERVLLRTEAKPDLTKWNSEFTAIAERTIHWLADHGVRLIGVDSPSIDPEASKDLQAHHAARRRDVLILESLVLSHVPPGRYELIALPLKLMNLDASPLRAILRTLPSDRT